MLQPRLALALALVSLAAAAPLPAADGDWQLVWEDGFDGPSLDWSKWEIEVNAFGGGNHELQLYTDRSENVRIEDGRLVLEARRDDAGVAGTVREFSSGRVRSKRRGDWTYGRFEVRAKLPKGRGLWPAIWMLPSDDRYGTWAASGEIDIMEFKGQEPHVLWGTLHYGDPWPHNRHSGTQLRRPNVDFSAEDHVYGLEWEPGTIRWLLDGEEWQTQSQWDSSGGDYPAPFDHPYHLVLNLAVGGEFLGPPDDTTPFPARFEVDWVKVFQRPPASSTIVR